ncbi:hypothetical protein [Bartonella rattaustraliani]|uniref:hypothetical protein n=1 Tax=Bartonella rattaustraliani TaxID=481139 RepID=UPI0002F03FBC|nr:hypothetical protein [Bartonella rattaustraliani]
MKSLSITRIITFIAFFSTSVLPASASFEFIDKLTRMFTSVDTLEKYNQLYNQYVSEMYISSMHFQKLSQAQQFVYSRGHHNMPSKFDTVLHRHVFVVLCGRFVNLLRGEYNEEMSWAMLPNVISRLRYDHNWSERDFMWAYNMSKNDKDPMIYYAKKLLKTSENHSINPETQMVVVVADVNTGDYENTAQVARFCRDLPTIFNIMKP